ncbi:MAG: transferrin-binding protein-like solute binding protein, partial [Neisseriaceae bacterium]|nr:transferrin-binding protein-like solute binding protein [Neisseriaceae bacterium]
KMKAKLVALAVISAFALSACGGGSDSSPKVNNKTNGGSAVSGDTGNGSGNSGSGNSGSGNSGSGNSGSGNSGSGNSGSGNSGSGNSGSGNSGSGNSGSGNSGSTTPDTPFTMEQQSASYTFTTNASGDPIKLVSATPKYETHNGDGTNYKTMVIAGKTITFKDTRGNGQAEDEHVRRVRDEAQGSTTFWEYVIAPSNPNITTRGTAYARYGYTVDLKNATTAQVKLFYQGNPTPINEMPTKGTATYQGFAIAIDPNKTVATSGEGDSFYGLSEFNADFANKKLTGTLNDWRNKHAETSALKEVKIAAEIRANTFKGTANGTGTAEGKFYGTKAQNLAGAFNDKTQNLQGVFGANKQ